MFTLVQAADGACIAESVLCCFAQRLLSPRSMATLTNSPTHHPNQTPPPTHHHRPHHADMSSQPPASPSSASAPSSSQPQPQPHQIDGHHRVPGSPQSRTDSAVHVDEMPDRADADSSFQSNASERHPKGKRKRTAYVYASRAATWGLPTCYREHPLLTQSCLQCKGQGHPRGRIQRQSQAGQGGASRHREARVLERERGPGTAEPKHPALGRVSSYAPYTRLHQASVLTIAPLGACRYGSRTAGRMTGASRVPSPRKRSLLCSTAACKRCLRPTPLRPHTRPIRRSRAPACLPPRTRPRPRHHQRRRRTTRLRPPSLDLTCQKRPRSSGLRRVI